MILKTPSYSKFPHSVIKVLTPGLVKVMLMTGVHPPFNFMLIRWQLRAHRMFGCGAHGSDSKCPLDTSWSLTRFPLPATMLPLQSQL